MSALMMIDPESVRSRFGSIIARGAAWTFFGVVLVAAQISCRPADDHDPETQVLASGKPVRSVVLVSLDTLRADRLGIYGYERDTSPNLDLLGAQGTVFDRAYAQASWTEPSHRSLFTSRVVSLIPEEATMLAEIFQAEGFRTGAFTGGGHMSAKFGFDAGFEVYEEDRKGGFASLFPMAEEWVRGVGNDRLFLFLHSYDIHEPYDPPAPYDTMFFPEYDGEITGRRVHDVFKRVVKARKANVRLDFAAELGLDDADMKQFSSLYDGGIRYTDTFIGRLVSFLKSIGRWDDTVVVVISDHGEEFWDHGSIGHGHTVFDELIRVPLLIVEPGRRTGGLRVDTVVQLMDVAPTLLELCGMDRPESYQGRSLVPVLEGRPLEDKGAVAESGGYKALVEFPWKLIARLQGGTADIYDLGLDPRETVSLMTSQSQRAEIMRSRLIGIVKSGEFDPVTFDESRIEDPEVLEQLRALGYIE
jgi:arylsulfatase A-like enzyme